MAKHAHATSTAIVDDGTPPAMDYKMHEATYKGFLRLLKWSIGAIVVSLVALYFIVNP